MNTNILQEKENSLFKRKEILAEVDSPDKTPSNQELKKELTSKLNTKESLIVIKQINQIFGKRTSKVLVYVYKDEKSLKEIEPVGKKKEEKPKEGAPVPAEQKPEAPKPVEVPKEQPKPEEKPKEEPKEEKKE